MTIDEQRRVERVGEIVDRVVRKLPCRERDGPLAVLDLCEAFFLGGRDDDTVLDEACRRIVERGVDAQRFHCVTILAVAHLERETRRIGASATSSSTAATISWGSTPARQR